MGMGSFRETWAKISLDSVAHNVREFRSRMKKDTTFMAVVKSDGYGHGAVEVAEAALDAGAEYLGVALLDEGIQLRRAGIRHPILILGYTGPDAVDAAVREDLTVTVYSSDVMEALDDRARHYEKSVRVHVKVDTGMSRIGLKNENDVLALALKAQHSPYIDLEGVFTHFADADSADDTFTKKQFDRFLSFVNRLEDNGIPVPLRHCCNSAGTMNYPGMHLDMVRVGISLYGLYPSAYLKQTSYRLKQAMHLKTRVSATRRLSEGEFVSYGCTFSPERESCIATLPIGYADGYSRLLSNRGDVLIHGQRARVVGRVCMDQTMIDVTDCDAVRIGDEVTLFGHSGEAFLSIDEVAEIMGTINYEVVCLITKRVPRVYGQNGRVGHTKNAVIDYESLR